MVNAKISHTTEMELCSQDSKIRLICSRSNHHGILGKDLGTPPQSLRTQSKSKTQPVHAWTSTCLWRRGRHLASMVDFSNVNQVQQSQQASSMIHESKNTRMIGSSRLIYSLDSYHIRFTGRATCRHTFNPPEATRSIIIG